MHKQQKIIVIGAGAAGLMAAGQAAQAGADVVLYEKMPKPGRKLAITGKGRCNLTNIAELTDFIEHFGKTGRFLHQTFSQFFSDELMDFFNKLGLELVTERGGRVFPACGKAPEVLKVLLDWVKKSGVKIKNASPVEKLMISNNHITGLISKGNEFASDAVILATGGASYPATGSTGDGYKLAESAGHSIVTTRPALVPLETAGNITAEMTDLNLRNIKVNLFINDKKAANAFGELVFTDFGVTGPVILTLSGQVVDALRDGKKVTFSIDLKPALDEKKLDARLLRDFSSRNKEPICSVLRGLLPKEMVPVCLKLNDISPNSTPSNINVEKRRRLRNWLKDFRLEVSGHRPYSEAIITAGGVNIKEINPKTMESLVTRGLYIAGELLDIQADTGGYNLQAAFSTGWLAGQSAALRGK